MSVSHPEFDGDLVYKLTKIIGNPNFSDLFKKHVNHWSSEKLLFKYVNNNGAVQLGICKGCDGILLQDSISEIAGLYLVSMAF